MTGCEEMGKERRGEERTGEKRGGKDETVQERRGDATRQS